MVVAEVPPVSGTENVLKALVLRPSTVYGTPFTFKMRLVASLGHAFASKVTTNCPLLADRSMAGVWRNPASADLPIFTFPVLG